jgi:adenylyltransferase/sulfurtransferase
MINSDRYQRQTLLASFGKEGQQRLLDSKVLVIGAGGLGVPVLTYLNAMGVGTLGIVDNDIVSVTNLHRQVLYSEEMVGHSKASSAKKQLSAQNSETKIIVYELFLDTTNALEIIRDYDVVVDATDNFPTRYLVNDACVLLGKPFVYGALHGFEGQLSVFNYKNGPTYRCLYPTMPRADEVPDCNEHGVLGILPGIIGNLQALETVKLITGIGTVLSGTLLLYDGLTQHFQKMKFGVNPQNKEIKGLANSYDFNCGAIIKSIPATSVSKLLEDGPITLVDVRTPQEYEANHLKGSINVPLDDLEEKFQMLESNTSVYLICQSGVRSQKAVLILQEMYPLKDFIQIEGGMNQLNTYANSN